MHGKQMTVCKQIRVHAVVVDHFSDPDLHRIQCCAVVHRNKVMVSISDASHIFFYPLVRSEHRHIGLHKVVFLRSIYLPVCRLACTLDLEFHYCES